MTTRKRVIMVVGMHRSGTSAVARGLEVLGVELGDRLMPAAKGNNDKGFYEDIDANAINVDVLQALGRDWDDLSLVRAEDFSRVDLEPLRFRAVELLRERLRNRGAYGLKDPRATMLLPFWQEVLRILEVDASYVICQRHPLSVAASLEHRDKFALEKSLYLWLAHVTAAMNYTAKEQRVVVSYERLMQDPARELGRIATALELPFEGSSAALLEYTNDFLARELQHSVHESAALRASHAVPKDVVEANAKLEMACRDEPGAAKALSVFFEGVAQRLEEAGPALRYVSRRELHFRRLVRERSEHLAQLESTASGLNDKVRELQLAVTARDGQIHALNLAAGERMARIESAELRASELKTLADALNAQSSALHDAIAWREKRIAELTAQVAEAKGQGESLRAAIAAETAAGRRRLVESFLEEARRFNEFAALHSKALPTSPQRAALQRAAQVGRDALNEGATAFDAGDADAASRIEAARSEWSAAISAACASFEETLADSASELEISRLRLLDTMREIARMNTQLGERQLTVASLEAQLAQRDATLRERERVLGQFGHQFVSRLGSALDPYPTVRWIINAPLRLVHWLLGHAKA